MFKNPGLEAVLCRGADALRRAPSYFGRVRREEARERRPAPERVVEVLGVVEVGELEVPVLRDVCVFSLRPTLCLPRVPRSAFHAIEQTRVLSSLRPEGRGSTSYAIAQTFHLSRIYRAPRHHRSRLYAIDAICFGHGRIQLIERLELLLQIISEQRL